MEVCCSYYIMKINGVLQCYLSSQQAVKHSNLVVLFICHLLSWLCFCSLINDRWCPLSDFELQNKASRYLVAWAVPIAFFSSSFFFLRTTRIPKPCLFLLEMMALLFWKGSQAQFKMNGRGHWRTSLQLWEESHSYSKSVHHSVLNLASVWVQLLCHIF